MRSFLSGCMLGSGARAWLMRIADAHMGLCLALTVNTAGPLHGFHFILYSCNSFLWQARFCSPE